jgi:hypothetical protein
MMFVSSFDSSLLRVDFEPARQMADCNQIVSVGESDYVQADLLPRPARRGVKQQRFFLLGFLMTGAKVTGFNYSSDVSCHVWPAHNLSSQT